MALNRSDGLNKQDKDRPLWTYVRDDRAAGSDQAPAVWFAYSPDRKGEHPQRHLHSFKGVPTAKLLTSPLGMRERARVNHNNCIISLHEVDPGRAQSSGVRQDNKQVLCGLTRLRHEDPRSQTGRYFLG